MMNIRKATEKDYGAIMQIWESAVKATHDFLREEDFFYYKEIIPVHYLPNAEQLYMLEDNGPKGFIGVAGDNLDMLFIDASSRGKGYGRFLLKFALEKLHITHLDVNEQNIQAVGFYEKMGFRKINRSEKDSMNKDYPVLHYTYSLKTPE